MTKDQIRIRLQTIIQELGAPVMDYSPTNANVERMVIIDKAVRALFALLRELEGDKWGD